MRRIPNDTLGSGSRFGVASRVEYFPRSVSRYRSSSAATPRIYSGNCSDAFLPICGTGPMWSISKETVEYCTYYFLGTSPPQRRQARNMYDAMRFLNGSVLNLYHYSTIRLTGLRTAPGLLYLLKQFYGEETGNSTCTGITDNYPLRPNM